MVSFTAGVILRVDNREPFVGAVAQRLHNPARFGTVLLHVEAIAGPFVQAGGTNTVGDDLEIGGATYTLSGGTLAVVSGLDGNEFVGFNGASGGFIQSGGTHVIAQFLQIGSQGSGTYVLSAGLLSMPVSGPFAFEGFGEFIGENSGGVGAGNGAGFC